MLDRRRLLISTAAAAPLAALGIPAAAREGGDEGARLTALLDEMMAEGLQESPELMTSLGMDRGPNAGARARLDDRSPVGLARTKALFERFKRALDGFDPARLAGMDAVNYKTARFFDESVLRSFGFPFGGGAVVGAAPYVVSQLTGNYRNVPEFLANQHRIDTADDANAYLSRLSAFAQTVDQESERARADFAVGATPPDFVLGKAGVQFAAMLAVDPARSELVLNLVRKTAAKGLAGDWEGRATTVIRDEVYPALRRQASLLAEALPGATHEAGCWRLPQGEAYYRFAVRTHTTTEMSRDEIHRLGLAKVAELTARAEKILRARGLTRGPVAQRIASLRVDPANLHPNTDAGRARLLADLSDQIAAVSKRLPDYFATLPRASVEVRRVPPAIEAGSPGGYYQPPSLDGSRPGAYVINLRDTAEWPRFELPTLSHHEAIPGHHLQNALALEAQGIPLLRKMPLFTGYLEGWALYAEQLADEMGMYEDNPLGRLGYVASLLFRATRLVVDSGLHHKRWSRERAVQYMLQTLGEDKSTTITEVERYCVWPAQACSYTLGHDAWNRARTSARQRLGPRFDIRKFHDAGLLAGAMPLTMLEEWMRDWAAGQARA